MKVLVTGAGGFLGRAVVPALLARGHDVVAMVRPCSARSGDEWAPDRVRVVTGDLRQRGSWCERLPEVDAVVHLAAAVSGDLAEQFSTTVVGTENLLAALPLESLSRFVQVSSLAVYDVADLADGSTLDETAPLEAVVPGRDPYSATKAIQERLVTEACRDAGLGLVVVRPGAILGPGKHWGWGSDARAGRLALIAAPLGRLPLTYIDNCAEAIALAVDAPDAAGRVVNLVDDLLPTRLGLWWMARRAGAVRSWPVPVPWTALRAMGWLLDRADRRWVNGRARLPELVSFRRQPTRWKPLRYSNHTAREVLGWRPAVPVAAAVANIVAEEGP